MSKHTPGPWTACMETFAGRPSGFHIAASPHGSARPICETGPRAEFEPSELEANARLIAAAPEMLALLKKIYDTGYGMREHTETEALIAKAEGRT